MIQRRALIQPLQQVGEFELDEAVDGETALQIVAAKRPEIVILDIQLSGRLNGFDVARAIVASELKCSIIMLTQYDDDANMIEGLESGAINYVAKPIRFRLLLAQIRSLAESNRIQRLTAVKIGDFTLFPNERTLVGGKGSDEKQIKIQLTDMQARALQYLHANQDGYVSVERLLSDVWHYAPTADTHTVQSHIHRIRDLLRSEGYEKDLILTKRNEGYRLADGDLDRLEQSAGTRLRRSSQSN